MGLVFAATHRPAKSEPAPAKTPSNRRGILAFVPFLAASVLIGGTAVFLFGRDPVLAERRTPETQDAHANGDHTPQSARVAGDVSRVLVDDNQRVRAGQVLMVPENDNFAASVREARAGVEAARAARRAAARWIRRRAGCRAAPGRGPCPARPRRRCGRW